MMDTYCAVSDVHNLEAFINTYETYEAFTPPGKETFVRTRMFRFTIIHSVPRSLNCSYSPLYLSLLPISQFLSIYLSIGSFLIP